MANKYKFSPLFYNWISYAGVWLAFFVFLAECFLFAFDYLAHGSQLYLGLLTYMVLPPFLFLGLALIPIGALIKRYRVKKGKASLEVKPLIINPSVSTHRNAIFVFMTVTFILTLMTFVGAYKSFHYTESVKFCGLLCHQVMNPEYQAYLKSPHANVKCVECHIGEGADYYLKSKLNGMRQIFKAATNTYEKPIPTPVHNLRPAQDTCKHCHWPGKFFGSMDVSRSYFLSDEANSRWDIRMLMKIGGEPGQNAGVHSHMNVDRDIYYVAEDNRRQKISWIKSVDKDGKETVYVSPESPYKDSQPPPARIRKMDCIDCHNRPTHHFVAPYKLVNEALSSGRIDSSLVSIKEKSVEVLSKKYASSAAAAEEIPKEILEYYEKDHPEVFAAKGEKIETAGSELARLYGENIFPQMNVRWDTHPDNIGHLVTMGCFRCHDGEHASREGRVVTRDCKACHLIIQQGAPDNPERNIEGLEFKHPDGSEDWKEMACNDCHSGGA